MPTARQTFFLFAAAAPVGVLTAGMLVWEPLLWLLVPLTVVILVGLHDTHQSPHAILRQYPVLGHGRYLAERIRPEIQQYFVESNTDGTPFSREQRAIVYQRAKGDRDNLPFGTQLDVYQPGYEFLAHSMYPKPPLADEPRVRVGGPDCTRPYEASLLNISAMSFGALSAAAVTALNRGAALGGFAHNTGEGGVSAHHRHGGDLIWQIGTGYFGCRTHEGRFDAAMFADRAALDEIKMIEIKLSQGAKPGHGGILPASKLTPEVAEIRRVPMGADVVSPPKHTAFDSPPGLLEFVAELRDLSGGKPVGFKLCVGRPDEFVAVVEAMAATGITPDFIVVDGAEGGTGAAPPELSDYVGMPLREALGFADTALRARGVRNEVRLVAAGKVASGFDIVRALALGADLCYSARAMMLALGCIQARKCHTNDCPVGVATQDPQRAKAIVVPDKAARVAAFHAATVANALELIGVAGCDHPSEIERHHVHRRVDQTRVASYAELFPTTPPPVDVTILPRRGVA